MKKILSKTMIIGVLCISGLVYGIDNDKTALDLNKENQIEKTEEENIEINENEKKSSENIDTLSAEELLLKLKNNKSENKKLILKQEINDENIKNDEKEIDDTSEETN
ncbi:hypothetical protein [uncultured Cetobacterium sp.]|uniref:hypothetical protein n=1 Tax=uncultured Cetobacterium sp. TaxID=527638 RepID=UPI00262576E9|nr:hypothetical protein [uncultured Cetobacterium sp.]